MPQPIITTDHPVAQCVDLRATFGDAYRYAMDPGFTGPGCEQERAWCTRMPCHRGEITPWGDRLLCWSSPKPGTCYRTGPNKDEPIRGGTLVANQVYGIPGTEVAQCGDDGWNVVFDADLFDQVAEIVRPRRRKQISEAERERLAELSRQYSAEGLRKARASLSVATGLPLESSQTSSGVL